MSLGPPIGQACEEVLWLDRLGDATRVDRAGATGGRSDAHVAARGSVSAHRTPVSAKVAALNMPLRHLFVDHVSWVRSMVVSTKAGNTAEAQGAYRMALGNGKSLRRHCENRSTVSNLETSVESPQFAVETDCGRTDRARVENVIQ